MNRLKGPMFALALCIAFVAVSATGQARSDRGSFVEPQICECDGGSWTYSYAEAWSGEEACSQAAQDGSACSAGKDPFCAYSIDYGDVGGTSLPAWCLVKMCCRDRQ